MAKLLAIGGPKHGDWLPDNNDPWGEILVPVLKRPLKIMTDPDVDMITDDPYYTVQYKVMTLADPATYATKRVYVVFGMDGQQAQQKLEKLLLEMFINSSVGDDM